MSQEEEIQTHLTAEIEVLERQLNSWAALGYTTKPEFRRAAERKQLLQSELELSKLRLSKVIEAKEEKELKQGSHLPYVTRAPAPVPRLRGGWTPQTPKPAQIPPDCPPYYPCDLWPRTQVILAEAVRKFPKQTQTLELCKHVISEMTSHLLNIVQAGRVKAHQALSDSGMGGLLHSLLVYNCDSDNERFQLDQEARKSDEWMKLAREMASAPMGNDRNERLDSDSLLHQRTTLSFTPHVPLSHPLTAEDRGESATIYIQAFVMAIPGRSIYLSPGAISGVAHQTLYNVYFDDPKFATQDSIVATYNASIAKITAGIGGRFFVGSILTPTKGGLPTIGNGDGGTPHHVFKSSAQPRIEAPGAAEGFSHSDDYRSVRVAGRPLTLTPRQAHVIQILHSAYEKATPDIGMQFILEKIESPSSRLRDSFKSNPEAWKALVRPGKKKGTIRLNV